MAIISSGIERMNGFLGHIRQLAAEGWEHEVQVTRRGAVDELALEIAWVEQHAAALVAPSAG
jgi:hypothetical protein